MSVLAEQLAEAKHEEAQAAAESAPRLPDVEIIRGDKRTREVATPQ